MSAVSFSDVDLLVLLWRIVSCRLFYFQSTDCFVVYANVHDRVVGDVLSKC